MHKIKNRIIYIFGAILTFIFKYSGVSAMAQTKYGIEPVDVLMYGVSEPIRAMPSSLSTLEKFIAIILSPIAITIFITTAFIIGTIIFIKRKRITVSKVKEAQKKPTDEKSTTE